MSTKQHIVRLTTAERDALRAVLGAGAAPARQQRRARILRKADAGVRGPRLSDRQIAEAVEVDPRTVARVRAAFAALPADAERPAGAPPRLDRVLGRTPPDRVYARKLDGDAEARLVTLACSTPPAGHARWSLRLLAGRLVALEVVDGISPETVRAALKKTSSSRG